MNEYTLEVSAPDVAELTCAPDEGRSRLQARSTPRPTTERRGLSRSKPRVEVFARARLADDLGAWHELQGRVRPVSWTILSIGQPSAPTPASSRDQCTNMM